MVRTFRALILGFALMAAERPLVAQERLPPPLPEGSEWRQALPLDSAGAARLLDSLRSSEGGLTFELRRLLDHVAFALAYDPPGLPYPWGDERPPPPCEPAACQALVEGLQEAGGLFEPYAFALRWGLDPVRWSDSLLARRDIDYAAFASARLITRRALAPPGAFPEAFPEPDADWEEWRDWRGRFGSDRFFGSDRSTRYAVVLARELRGRDVGAELVRGYERAEEDSARLVFGRHAAELGAIEPAVEEVVRNLDSSSEPLRELGRSQVAVLGRSAGPADRARAAALQRQMLARLLDGDRSWSGRGPLPRASVRSPAEPIYIITDALVPGVADPWADEPGLILASRAETDSIASERAVSFLSVGRVRDVGPFAWIGARTGRMGPRETAPFMGYPSMSRSLVLVRGPEAWKIVESSVIAVN